MTNVRLVLMLGTYVSGTHAAGTVDDRWNSPRVQWGRRLDRLFEPDEDITAFAWVHERAPYPVTAVDPNLPSAGDTRITLAVPHFRTVGETVRLKLELTGIAAWDELDLLEAEVTGASELVVRGQVATSSATGGLCRMGFAERYHSDANSHTDATHGGRYGVPDTVFGPDHTVMQLLQDAQLDEDPDAIVLLLKLAVQNQALRSRSSVSQGRWLQEFEGDGVSDGSVLPVGAKLSLFEDLRSLLVDVRAFLSGTFGIAAANVSVHCLAMGHGLNEGNLGDPLQGRRTYTIASAALDGTDLLLTIQTSATVLGHALSKTAGKAWQVGAVAGLTTDPDGLAGRLWEVEAETATQLRVRGFVANTLPTFDVGTATIEVGDPGYWFQDDMLSHLDSVRALIADIFGAQTADEIPTVLLVPDRLSPNAIHTACRNVLLRVPGRRQNVSIVDMAGLDRASDPSFAFRSVLALSSCTLNGTVSPPTLQRPAGGLLAYHALEALWVTFADDPVPYLLRIAGVVSDTQLNLVPNLTSIGGLPARSIAATNKTQVAEVKRFVRPESPLFYSLDGTLELGRRIAEEAMTPSAPVVLSAKRPAIVVGVIAHSFGIGKPYSAWMLDNNPDLIAKVASPQNGQKVWNVDAGEWQDRVLDFIPPISNQTSHPSGQNVNTHPAWNYAQLLAGGGSVGFQAALHHALREQFPDEIVWVVNLASNGSCLATPTQNVNSHGITNILVGPDAVLIEIDAVDGLLQVNREVVVTISGVTGLSPALDGQHSNARPALNLSPSGRHWIAIPGTYTGTPLYGAATLRVRPPVWNPSAGELWTSWADDVVKPAMEALWEAGYVPDWRAQVVALGENDASQGIAADFAASLDEIVDAIRSLQTTRGKPREFGELPIVWAKPFLHSGLSVERLAQTEIVRDALDARAQADQWFRTFQFDQAEDWLLDPVKVSADDVHPTLTGYAELGYRLARVGLASIAGWQSRHPVDFSPQDVVP